MSDARPVRTLHKPITLNGRFTVSCDQCDAAFDSDATTPEAAQADFARRHRHGDRTLILTAEPTDYKAHPLFVGRFEHADAKTARQAPREVTTR